MFNSSKRKIIVYGINRYQKDFEYMFPKVNIIAYITNSKNIKNYNKKKCFYTNEIPDELKKHTLIICDRKNKKNDTIIKNLNFKNYFYLEDIGYLLDNKIYKYKYKIMKKTSFNWNLYKYFKNSDYFKQIIYTDPIDNVKCDYPFRYVQIQPGGFIYPCCSGWSKIPIGNIILESPKKVWNSNLARLYRLSIINKTYIFCNKNKCPYITNSTEKTDTRFDIKTEKIPNEVCIAIDKSCNLKCPSCRNDFCNLKGKSYMLAKYLSRKLINSNWLTNSKKLTIASQGEVFFSKIYKKIIFNSKVTKRNSITIHTNGTLLTNNVIKKLCSIYNEIEFFISIDAVTEETYKKIRVGGNFKNLMKNLENLSIAKINGNKIKSVTLLFVVQRENYKEMIDFVKLAKKLSFDKIEFSKIENWETYSDEEFEKISMFNKHGKPKKELKNILKNNIFDDDIVSKYSNVIKFR